MVTENTFNQVKPENERERRFLMETIVLYPSGKRCQRKPQVSLFVVNQSGQFFRIADGNLIVHCVWKRYFNPGIRKLCINHVFQILNGIGSQPVLEVLLTESKSCPLILECRTQFIIYEPFLLEKTADT